MADFAPDFTTYCQAFADVIIAECLGMATKLTKLDVSANGLSPAARRALADAADANPKLRVRF